MIPHILFSTLAMALSRSMISFHLHNVSKQSDIDGCTRCSNGTIDQYKSQLVENCFAQTHGMVNDETNLHGSGEDDCHMKCVNINFNLQQ